MQEGNKECFLIHTGPEKLVLFSKIDIPNLLPNVNPTKTATIQSLWCHFLEVNRLLCGTKELDLSVLETKCKKWVDTFVSIYQTKRVTPYIHALHSHVSQFLYLHGSIAPFSQQALEKYNDRLTKTFFR